MRNKSANNIIRLFGMSALQIKSSLDSIEKEYDLSIHSKNQNSFRKDNEFYPQFDFNVRSKAKKMAQYYEIFYCLENSIRQIIREVLISKFGDEWWQKSIDETIRKDVDQRIERDIDSSFTLRSDDKLDFANFGELTNIIEKQWDSFNDLFISKSALKRVMTSLNNLRGPIAHCSMLAEDEIKRLELTIKDWFRLMS